MLVVSFPKLPRDLKLLVFTFFEPRTLCHILCRVCKQWRSLANDNVVWKTKLNRQFPRRAEEEKGVDYLEFDNALCLSYKSWKIEPLPASSCKSQYQFFDGSYSWDPKNMWSSFALSNNNKTIFNNSNEAESQSWKSAIGRRPLKHGIISLRIRVDQHTHNEIYSIVAVGFTHKTPSLATDMSGFKPVLCYFSTGGLYRYPADAFSSVPEIFRNSTRYNQGDIISLRLDLDEGEVEFKKNSEKVFLSKLPPKFYSGNFDWYLGVSLSGGNKVTVLGNSADED